MGKLDGKFAIVTGGADGMGAAHCRILAEEGATVAVCDIDVEQGTALAGQIGGMFHRLDVTDEQGWARVVATVADTMGLVSILINNAGVSALEAVQDVVTDNWNRVMAINVTGAMFGTRAVVPQMIAAGGGVIVNVSSAAGMEAAKGMAAYTASKWAVRGLTKASALDLAEHNIRVLSLHPALVRTPMSSGIDIMAATANYPIARPGEPKELARMLLFMVAEATFSTGCEFVADGGKML